MAHLSRIRPIENRVVLLADTSWLSKTRNRSSKNGRNQKPRTSIQRLQRNAASCWAALFSLPVAKLIRTAHVIPKSTIPFINLTAVCTQSRKLNPYGKIQLRRQKSFNWAKRSSPFDLKRKIRRENTKSKQRSPTLTPPSHLNSRLRFGCNNLAGR